MEKIIKEGGAKGDSFWKIKKNKHEEWTNKIKAKTSELRQDQTEPRQPITTEEVERVIKKLRRNKAMGPDEIPNELFIEANQTTREILTQILNTIHTGKPYQMNGVKE